MEQLVYEENMRVGYEKCDFNRTVTDYYLKSNLSKKRSAD